MDVARLRAELSLQELWLRYVGLGGTGDAFDLDGYLQGLVPLETFQQDVLAQAVNEALADSYDSYSVPPATPAQPDERSDARLRSLTNQLLDQPFRRTGDGAPPPPADGGCARCGGP